MTEKLLILLIIISAFGCSRQKRYPIESVQLNNTHYLDALNDIDREIDNRPGDASLRRRRLLINRELHWPDDVSDDIAQIKKQEGLDYELLQYAIDFYNAHHYYESLLNVIDEWESLNGEFPQSDRWKIIAMMGLNRNEEAKYLLWRLIQNHKNESQMLLFAAENYLELHDTTRAVYAYNRLAETNPDHPVLLESYVPVLLRMGYAQRAIKVLEAQRLDSTDVTSSMMLASTFYQLGEEDRAHALLSAFDDTSVLYQRAAWYEQALQWDSAVVFLNRVIMRDSSTTALMKKAALLDKRGWLSSSYSVYSIILEKDSSNTIARESAQNVARKIAYLRSLREAEKEIPVLDITSKKETENE